MPGVEHPDADRRQRHETRQLNRAASIAAPLADVVPGDQRRGYEHGEDHELRENRRPFEPRPLRDRLRHSRRRRPGRDLLEVHRPAAIRRRFDAQLLSRHVGQRPGPRGASVGVEGRRPFRCGVRECRPIQTRGGEERLPVNGLRWRRRRTCPAEAALRRRRIQLRRHDCEADQAPFRVHHHHRHPGRRHRRLVRRDAIPIARQNHERRAAAIPEVKSRRTARRQPLTTTQLRVVREVAQEIGDCERVGGVHVSRVSQRAENLPGAFGEEHRRLRQRHDVRHLDAIRQRHPHADGEQGGAEAEQRGGRFQCAGRSGGSDHFRRRRFPGGERGRERIAARQRGRDGQRRRRAEHRIRFEAAHDRAVDRGIQVADELRRVRDAVLLAFRDELRQVAPFDRALPGEELVEHEPQRVDVAARRHLAAGELLRRHVSGRTGTENFTCGAGETEVGNADPAVAVEHHVRGLQVAVDDAAIVRGGEAGAHLARHFDGAVLGEAADAAEQRRQILAVDVFHREEGVPLVLADVVDAAHVRVRDLPREPHFGVQLHQARGIAIHHLRQELQRDGLPELEIVGAIDLAHPAFPEASDDAVADVEDGAGRKAAVIDRVGARQPAAGRHRLRGGVSGLVGVRRFGGVSHGISPEARWRARRL